MRIAFDAKRLFNNYTGLGNYSRTLVADLAHADPDSDWFLCADKMPQNDRTLPFFNRVQFELIHPRNKQLFWRQLGVLDDLKANKIQLYHGLSNELPFGLSKVGIRQVVTIHDVLFYDFPADFPLIDRQIYQFKFRSACRKADKIIAISEHTKLEIIDRYHVDPDRIEVIYQSCDPRFFRSISEESKALAKSTYHLPQDYMLYVGTLNSRKNALIIVKALQQMAHDKRIPLVIVGDGGKYKDELFQFIQYHQLEAWIHWIPKLDFSLLPAIYAGASLFIFPSKGEGFGIPVLEAMAVGIPVITSNLSSLKEVGGDAARLINPTDLEQLRDSIDLMLGDSHLRQEMVEKGKQQAMRFDRQIATQKVLNLYHSLI